MTLDDDRCRANTKTGARCRIRAVEGSVYCHVHQSMEEAESSGAPDAQAGPEALPPRSAARFATSTDINTDMLIGELESLIEELQKRSPEFLPSSATPGQIFALFNSILGQYAPERQRQAFNQLEKDLAGGETWTRTLGLVSNLAYTQALAVSSGIADRVSFLPGVKTLSHLMGNLEGTSANDLLDPETWQGLWYILNYTVQLQIDQAKERITGGDQERAVEEE